MHFIAERIYTTTPDGEVTVRPGTIGLEPEDSAELFGEPPRILYTTGLSTADFAVFLELEEFNAPDRSYGYLVTAVEEDGEGIMVLGDAVESDPQTWMTDRLADLLLFLGEEQVSEFNLAGLYQAVRARKQAA